MTAADRPAQRVAVVVLAAGASRRLGRPKQLLPYRGRTLIHHAAETALVAGVGPVTVVLGAHADQCRAALKGLEVRILVHERWAEGMGSTIGAAVRAALEGPGVDAVLFTTCDQPDVGPDDLRLIVETQRRTGKPLVAAEYQGTIGVPALFAGDVLPSLAGLTGTRGAKSILEAAGPSLVTVPCASAGLDVDTARDAAKLK